MFKLKKHTNDILWGFEKGETKEKGTNIGV